MGLSRDDYVWPDPPAWIPTPLRRVLADLTYDEAHGMLMGLSGLLAGAGFAAGGIVALVAAVGTALLLSVAVTDVPVGETFVASVLQRNAWYWLVPYTLTALLGAALVGL